jgi:hypothetical protein
MPPHWKVGTCPVLDQTTTTIITAGEAMIELNPVVAVHRVDGHGISILHCPHLDHHDAARTTMTTLRFAILFVLMVPPTEASTQGAITTCQNIVGQSLTPPAQWDEDAMTGGYVTVTRNGTRYDLIIKDSISTFSALADGAKIANLRSIELAEVGMRGAA